MAKWVPNAEEVGPGETVGRRLFDQPSLVGATDQKAALRSLDYRNFEDDRDGEVSLDRLGKGNPEKATMRYLTSRAEAAGKARTPSKTFDGWTAIKVKKLVEHKNLKLAIVASPLSGLRPELGQENDLSANIFHCHVSALDNTDPYFFALHLQALFEKHGTLEISPNSASPSLFKKILFRIIGVISRLAEKSR
jgi:hypothetical protein